MNNYVSVPIYRLERILKILQQIPEKTATIENEILQIKRLLGE